MIAIVDYGMGNIHSVQKALRLYGAQTLVTNRPQDLKICDKIVLPGVGAFEDAMKELEKRDLISSLKEEIGNKKIFFGICLGMQLLFEESQESQNSNGLSILRGKVKKFVDRTGLKVPHMGWNQLKINPSTRSRIDGERSRTIKNGCPLLKDIPDASNVYFCHSYYPEPEDKSIIAATCDYGINFTAILWQDNIFGVQFHPEKSQDTGLKMLKNFVEL